MQDIGTNGKVVKDYSTLNPKEKQGAQKLSDAIVSKYGADSQKAKAYSAKFDTTLNQTPTYYGDPGSDDNSKNTGYDYTSLISALQSMNQQKYSALKEALLANKQRQDDMANKQYAQNIRQWKKTYGNGLSGAGLSNKFNLMANRDANIRDNETDYLNNMATLSSNKYDDYANLATGLSGLDENSLKKILSLI